MRSPAARIGPAQSLERASPRHERDSDEEANASVPDRVRTADRTRAAAGARNVTHSPTSSGPEMKISSCAVVSRAKAAWRPSPRPSRTLHSARPLADSGGMLSPASTAHAVRRATSAPKVAPAARPIREMASSVAHGSRTLGWPKRSTSRPWTGAMRLLAIA